MTTDNSATRMRAGLLALFLASGLLIYLFGNNWTQTLPTNRSLAYKAGLPLLFLAAAVWLRSSRRGRPYWPIAFALFIGSSAVLLTRLAGNWLARLFPGEADTTMQELALDKLSEAILVVLTILVLTRIERRSPGSLFLQKGDLRRGLRFGLAWFGAFALAFAVIVALQSGESAAAPGIGRREVVASIPWILAFVSANSLMEELWFRGIYMKKLDPFLGARSTNLVTALVFGLAHLNATYVSPVVLIAFPLVVFGLGLANGSVMLKTDSIVGSFLFHAGYDLIVILPIIASAQ